MTIVLTAPLRRPTPWLKIALIAGGLCAAAAGWLLPRMKIADHETAAAWAEERARLEQQLAAHQNDQRLQEALARNRIRDQAIEQQLAGRHDQEALVWERARSKELEQQLAVRYVDKEALAKELARGNILEQELEQQLAARQGDQEALAQERARSLALERELMKLRYTVPTPLPAFELFPTWPALALNSIDPAPPPPAAREAMPAAPTDEPAGDKAPIDKSAADARDRGRY
jgi:lipopolysaccharide export LptBFGC system permease protein LptF